MAKKKKDQFVIAYLADLDRTDAVVGYARAVAGFLHKGLILLFVCDKKYTSLSSDVAQKRLAAIKERYPGEDINVCVLKGNTREVITLLPTLLNAVIVVAGVNRRASILKPTHPRRLLWDFGQCRTAYLTVQYRDCEEKPKNANADNLFRNVALRIDYDRQSKEKLIWASYFARFNASRLHVIHENHRDSRLRTKFENNMLFLENFFGGLGVKHETETMPSASNFPDRQAVRQAVASGYDLLICTTTDTRERDPLDWFIGTQESRVVRNKECLPVLFINPRDDIYVLCD